MRQILSIIETTPTISFITVNVINYTTLRWKRFAFWVSQISKENKKQAYIAEKQIYMVHLKICAHNLKDISKYLNLLTNLGNASVASNGESMIKENYITKKLYTDKNNLEA